MGLKGEAGHPEVALKGEAGLCCFLLVSEGSHPLGPASVGAGGVPVPGGGGSARGPGLVQTGLVGASGPSSFSPLSSPRELFPKQVFPKFIATKSVLGRILSSSLVVEGVLRNGGELGDLEHSIVRERQELQVCSGEAGGASGGGAWQGNPVWPQFTNPTSCLFVCLKVRV